MNIAIFGLTLSCLITLTRSQVYVIDSADPKRFEETGEVSGCSQ